MVSSFVLSASMIASAVALGPRAHVMTTHLQPAAMYTAVAHEHGLGLRLVVKFADGLDIRGSAAAHGSTRAGGVTTTVEASRLHAVEINHTLAAHGATVRPVLAGVGPEWEALVARAEGLSGRAQPDLRAMMQIDIGTAASATELVALGRALAALPSVEFAEIEFTGMPPPGSSLKRNVSSDLLRDCPVPPPKRNASMPSRGPTPDFTPLQRYSRGPEEGGFDAEWAAAQGADGAGVRYSDCEYCWIWDHEDVIQIKEEGHPCDPNMFADHGTASVGVTSGIDNGFGILGIAPNTSPFTYSEWTDNGGRRERAIAQAVADSGEGDIVLLEMQTGSGGPPEAVEGVWLILRVGADANVVVVSAAGNGNQDLDGPSYEEFRGWGDSGSIIVGAGSSDTEHNKLSFSTYGERVNIHCWGQNVMTAGYGVCEFEGSEPRERHYTPRYSGTSSASALTAGAVTAIQSYSKNFLGRALQPLEMRELLASTGLPQGDPEQGDIGPFIQMRSAIEALQQQDRAK